MALTNDDLRAIADLLQPTTDDIHMIKNDIKELQKDTQELKKDTQELKNRVTSIELTLENETNPGIKIIAEGHLDLNQKLDNALKVENEKEMLLLRVNHLENEMRKVKERLDHIA